jgi:hypothetical protein
VVLALSFDTVWNPTTSSVTCYLFTLFAVLSYLYTRIREHAGSGVSLRSLVETRHPRWVRWIYRSCAIIRRFQTICPQQHTHSRTCSYTHTRVEDGSRNLIHDPHVPLDTWSVTHDPFDPWPMGYVTIRRVQVSSWHRSRGASTVWKVGDNIYGEAIIENWELCPQWVQGQSPWWEVRGGAPEADEISATKTPVFRQKLYQLLWNGLTVSFIIYLWWS